MNISTLSDRGDFGEHASYRLGAAYLAPFSNGEVKIRGAYGTGFRAPSLLEAAYNFGPFAAAPVAGLQLQEEQSNGYDVRISWAADDGSYLEATSSDQTVSDETFFDPINFSGYLQGNGEFGSSGIELVAMLPLPGGSH
ncbi:MAG: TonB-dependent receptor [Congregibacter sp.]